MQPGASSYENSGGKTEHFPLERSFVGHVYPGPAALHNARLKGGIAREAVLWGSTMT